jgi:hypothetical protein
MLAVPQFLGGNDGQLARDADSRASEWGLPAPPDGYTFVKPHQRGAGDVVDKPTKLVCSGLQIVAIFAK